ncbi:MAG: hypothetical protein AAGC93_02160 [Cyanobacteria bacterium P01_F01_bin.53]
MTTSLLYSNDLTISPYARAIPYAADRIAKPTPQTNYGFKNLKIKPSLIETIPELVDDSPLQALVKSINKGETCFFTVGCFSERTQTDEGYRRQGYLAFAWNCTSCIQDAINYFALYFHFEKSLKEKGFNQPVRFRWILQETAFSDVKIDGFACAIHIETRSLSSVEQAEQVWQLSLRMIESYLETVKTQSSTLIYKPLSDCSSELSTQ